MSKRKAPRPIKITTNQILDYYANSLYEEDVDSFWRFINAANDSGMLFISLNDVQALLDNSFGTIQNKRYNLETSLSTSPSGRQTRRDNKE